MLVIVFAILNAIANSYGVISTINKPMLALWVAAILLFPMALLRRSLPYSDKHVIDRTIALCVASFLVTSTILGGDIYANL